MCRVTVIAFQQTIDWSNLIAQTLIMHFRQTLHCKNYRGRVPRVTNFFGNFY